MQSSAKPFQVLCIEDYQYREYQSLTRSKTDHRFSTQIRFNVVEVMRLLHDTLTLKEAKVALNTDMYH